MAKKKSKIKKAKQTGNILLNTIIFIALTGTAFSISYIFGIFFFFGFLVTIYNKDIRKKPWKTILIFIGGLITRFALGKLITTIPNASITLDFLIAFIMLIFIFLFGWKAKRI